MWKEDRLRAHLWKEEVELEVDAHQLRDSGLHHILEVGVESEKGAVDGDHDVLARIFVSKFFLAHLNPHLVVHLFEQSCDSSTCHHTCTSGNCLADIPTVSNYAQVFIRLQNCLSVKRYSSHLSEEQSSSVISSGSIPSSSIACLIGGFCKNVTYGKRILILCVHLARVYSLNTQGKKFVFT